MHPRSSDIEIKSLNFQFRQNGAGILILLNSYMPLEKSSKGSESQSPTYKKRRLILHRAEMRMKYEKAYGELGTLLIHRSCQCMMA